MTKGFQQSFGELPTLAKAKYDQLFSGVDSVVLMDVPDYANSGDSAIFLGLLNYLEAAGIEVTGAYSRGTMSHKAIKNADVVAFLGGGSFGGLSPESDELRLWVAANMKIGSLLIQCPQSVVFTSTERQNDITQALLKPKNFRFAARDIASQELLKSAGLESKLVPDSSHFLNLQSVSNVTRGKIVYLVREDGESTGHHIDTIDSKWNQDSFSLKISRGVRLLGRYSERLATRVNPTVDEWKSIAQARLNRALAQIGDAEIVVTNRLHGMLLSRMSGKPVVYFDNTNRKLTAYMQTWMRDNDGVIQATDVNMAEFIAQDLIGKDVGGR